VGKHQVTKDANAPRSEAKIRTLLRRHLEPVIDDAIDAYFQVAPRRGHAAGMEAALEAALKVLNQKSKK
jgi:hypothetical protein